MSACAAEIDEMMTKAASPVFSPLASSNGRAASNAFTAPSTSSRKFCSHEAGSPPCAMAPALENSMSTLPSSLRDAGDPRLQRGGVGDIHGRAGGLHAHRLQLGNGCRRPDRRCGRTPRRLAPSPASVSAIARPMPRVPPSTTAFLPFKPKSICFSFVDTAHCSGEARSGRKLKLPNGRRVAKRCSPSLRRPVARMSEAISGAVPDSPGCRSAHPATGFGRHDG